MTAKPIIIVLVAAICAVAVTSLLAQHTNSASEGSSKTQAPPPLQSPSLTNRNAEYRPQEFNLATHLETLTRGTNSIDEAGVISLLRALTNRYENLVLEEDALQGVKQGLWQAGKISQTNDDAYAFFRAASQPGFWEQHRTWKAKHRDYRWNKALTRWCIMCLTISCRPEDVHLLEELRRTPDIGYLVSISGAIVHAYFQIDMIQRYGRDAFLSFESDRAFEEFVAWKNTAKGQELGKWSREVNKLHVEQRSKAPDLW